MHFRSYTPSDIEAMCRLDTVCFAEPFRFDCQTMQQFAEAHGAIVVLVEDEGRTRLIGFTILHLEGSASDSRAYVVTIDVSPEHRCRGVGAAMLDRAEDRARSGGAVTVSLHVSAENLAAISFYERQHYLRVGRVKRFYREADQDAIHFAKPI